MAALKRLLFILGLLAPVWAHGFYVSFSLNALAIDFSAGHEEITRQGFELLKKEGLPEPLKDPKAPGLLKLGVFATDIPRGKAYPLSLIEFWNLPEDIDWHNDMAVYTLHSLRREVDSGLQSAREACMEVKEKIAAVSWNALEFYRQGEVEKSFFLLGHALHNIQDSFSPAHTVRDGRANNSDLQEICYYGSNISLGVSLCYHEANDPRDFIWLSMNPADIQKAQAEWGPDQVLPVDVIEEFKVFKESEESKSKRLKHEARLAKYASARYLSVIGRLLEAPAPLNLAATEVAQTLENEFFSGVSSESRQDPWPEVMPQGVIRCQKLSPRRIPFTQKGESHESH